MCWKETMKKHGVGNDLLVTSPPPGSYTVSAELGAVLDTQVLLLEQSDMFNHLPPEVLRFLRVDQPRQTVNTGFTS